MTVFIDISSSICYAMELEILERPYSPGKWPQIALKAKGAIYVISGTVPVTQFSLSTTL